MTLLGGMKWAGRLAWNRAFTGLDRKRRRSRDLFDVACRVSEIAPAHVAAGNPCLMLPNQLERVKAAAFATQLPLELEQMRGAPRTSPPLRRFEFTNVMIEGSSVYSSEGRKYFNYHLPDPSFQEPVERYDTLAARSSFIGTFFFGHWLRDDCASHLLAKEEGEVASIQHPNWPDTDFYSEAFSQQFRTVRRAFVRRLILFDDISQNPHKAERFHQLRHTLSQKISSVDQNQIVYLKRGSAGAKRQLLNETEVTEALEKRGIKIVQAEGLAANELASMLLKSRLVISVEGSQISHALYTLRAGGGVLAIQPPMRLFNSHMDWTRVMDMHYGIVVGVDQGNQDFTLPVDDLLRTIDLMEARIG
jgi:Glycosyltransferase 61